MAIDGSGFATTFEIRHSLFGVLEDGKIEDGKIKDWKIEDWKIED